MSAFVSGNGHHHGFDAPPVMRLVKRARTTKRTPGAAAGWNDFKDEIYTLYAEQNCSLEDLMKMMAKKGLKASRRTYMKRITEWGFNKKIRRAEKDVMLSIERRRSAIGKKTNFRIRGQEVSMAKLRRAAATAGHDEEEGVDDLPDLENTLSCISYSTPAASDADAGVEAGGDGYSAVHTSSWTEMPGEQIWRMRSRTREQPQPEKRPSFVWNPAARPDWAQTLFLPFAGERNVAQVDIVSVKGEEHSRPSSSSSRDLESELVIGMPPPPRPNELTSNESRPFKLRRFLTSTMPSLNYAARTTLDDHPLGGLPQRHLIAGVPDDGTDIVSAGARLDYDHRALQPIQTDRGSPTRDLEHHIALFEMALCHNQDLDRNQHFSIILGILKSQYDREGATHNHMAVLFEGDDVCATEEDTLSKIKALLDHRHRSYGYGDKRTLETCLAGIIFLLDANRLDLEQTTWLRSTVRTRLERVRSLMGHIFAAHLQVETTLELLGDDEGRDVENLRTESDEETRRMEGRMMRDIVVQARKSRMVLHVLDLLPRYHRQWAMWHAHDQSAGKRPMSFCSG